MKLLNIGFDNFETVFLISGEAHVVMSQMCVMIGDLLVHTLLDSHLAI